MKFIRRHKFVTVLGAVFIALAIASAVTGCAKATSSTSTPVSASQTAIAAPAISTASAPVSSSPSHSSVSQAAALAGVYKSVCDLLGHGGTQADVVSVVDDGLQKDGITGYSGKQIVKDAEKKDCPKYLHTAPALTVAQQQAVQAAQDYLSMGSGFSYNSLLDQLTSSAGNGFSQTDAKAAIKSLHLTEADWDAQAVDAAKGYMSMGGFSRASLIDQLTSSAGNGFTLAEATYAANKVGL